MNKIIATIIGFALVAAPALACCNLQDTELEVNTFFTNDGPISAFQELTSINYGDQVINEAAFSWMGELTVASYEAFTWNGCEETLNADKLIFWDPSTDESSYLSIGKDVYWEDGSADVYVQMQDPWGDNKAIHAGGIGDGLFMNRIETHEALDVYQSVGLNQFATCGTPRPPTPLPPPTCEWCE
jgi:hypothetical protein